MSPGTQIVNVLMSGCFCSERDCEADREVRLMLLLADRALRMVLVLADDAF